MWFYDDSGPDGGWELDCLKSNSSVLSAPQILWSRRVSVPGLLYLFLFLFIDVPGSLPTSSLSLFRVDLSWTPDLPASCDDRDRCTGSVDRLPNVDPRSRLVITDCAHKTLPTSHPPSRCSLIVTVKSVSP